MLDWFQAKLSISAVKATLANARIVVTRIINIFFIVLLSRNFES